MRTSTEPVTGLTGTALLEVTDLVAGYGSVPIVRGVDLAVTEATTVAIVGPNGAGKSTLLKAILGLVPAMSGRVTVGGWTPARRRPEALIAHGVGYLPQVGNVFPSLTVAENLRMGVYIAPRSFGQRSETVLSLFPTLKSMMNRRAGVLSGGERTMLGLARALMSDPRLVLLDEPSSGLAPKVVGQVWDKLRELRAAGIALLVVEQRARDILQLADEAYVLVAGTVARSGPCRDWSLDELGELFLRAAAGAPGPPGPRPARA
jgi:ABC-type branched-subunit amino acid transport system ATPase component